MNRIAAVALVSAAGVIGVALAESQDRQAQEQQAQPEQQQQAQQAQAEPAQQPEQAGVVKSFFKGEPQAPIAAWRSPFTPAPGMDPPSRADEEMQHDQMVADAAHKLPGLDEVAGKIRQAFNSAFRSGESS